jgi:hypothetical protein
MRNNDNHHTIHGSREICSRRAIGRAASVSMHETSFITDFQRCIRSLPRRGHATQAAHKGWAEHWVGVMMDRIQRGLRILERGVLILCISCCSGREEPILARYREPG